MGLVIIQAFPRTYHQHQQQRFQMALCAAEGMPFDCYVYDYLGDPTWLWGALDGIDAADEKPRMAWLDEEDTETEKGWAAPGRVSAISNSIGSVKQRGYPCGMYAGRWWWGPKTGDFKGFSDLKLWTAQYDTIPDASVFNPFGGWATCAIKQYAGTQPDGTDLNVLSAQEEQDLLNPDFPGVPVNPIPPDPPDCGPYKAALERGVNRLQLELDRKTSAGKTATLRRTLITEIQRELFGALQ